MNNNLKHKMSAFDKIPICDDSHGIGDDTERKVQVPRTNPETYRKNLKS